MGTGIDAAAAIDHELSPRYAAIEKAQAELRREVTVREERRRELEFLEKGGNPLDFKFGEASVALQSALSSDQLAEQFFSSGERSNSVLGTPSNGNSLVDNIGHLVQSKQSLNHLNKVSLDAAIGNSADPQPISDVAVGLPFSDDQQLIVEKKVVDYHGGVRGGLKGQYERRNRSRSNQYGNGQTANDLEKAAIGDSSPTSSFGAKGSLESSTEVQEVGDENETPGTQMELCSDIYKESCRTEKKKPSVYMASSVHVQECEIGEVKNSEDTCANMWRAGDQSSGALIRLKSSKSPNDQEDALNIYQNNSKVTAKEDSSKISNDQETDVVSGSENNISIVDKVKDKLSATSFSSVELQLGTTGSNVQMDDPSAFNDLTKKNLETQVDETAEKALVEPEVEASGRVLCSLPIAKHDENMNGKDDIFNTSTDQEDRKLKLNKVVESHSNGLVPNGERDNRCGEEFCSNNFLLPAAEATNLNTNTEWAKSKSDPEASRRKCQWDFLLEEMAWMANDFMQERLWKMAAASQVACWIAEQRGQPDFHDREVYRRQRKIAHCLSSSVMKFWRSVETLLLKDKLRTSQYDDSNSIKSEENVEFTANVGSSVPTLIAKSEVSDNDLAVKRALSVQDYAIRFIKQSMAYQSMPQAEAPPTPERISETEIFDSWEDQFPEESLHYIVPPGAMEAYRLLMESQWDAEYKQRLQEHAVALAEADVQAAETTEDSLGVSDSGQFDFANETQSLTGLSPSSRDIALDNDDARLHYLPGTLDGSKSIIHKKKRKKIFKTNTFKIAEAKPSYGFSQYMLAAANADSHNLLPSFHATGKRTLPGGIGSGVGTIPPRRMRTSAVAARHKAGGGISVSNLCLPYSSSGLLPRSDISSGETNSQQDDLNIMHDYSISDRLDVESSGISGKGTLKGVDKPYKNKKKRKVKHHGGCLIGSGTQRMGMSMTSSAKKEHLKRKGEQYSHVGMSRPGLESFGGPDLAGVPGSQGLAGKQPLKKMKLVKQSTDANMEAFHAATTTASSQSTMNNVCNTSKLKQISNRDRNRKNKSLKGLSHQGLGIPWSSVEDQALLGLVPELGTNWELMSDILSSTSQLKGIFRKPKECRERHATLIERLTGNGGDSPEDSCSSQPHSSNSAVQRGGTRLALHRLHGPMEEDTLKAHIECIVRLHHQYLSTRIQNDLQEQRQQASVHQSHTTCIQQICLSNLSGGPLTPLELCEHSLSNGDLPSHAFALPSTHGNGLDISGILASGSGMHSSSGGISLLQGTSSLALGAGVLPTGGAVAARDVQCMVVPLNPLSAEQQQIRFNRIASGRGLQSQGVCATSGLTFPCVSNPSDCAVPVLPTGNSGGMLCGFSRSMSLSRAGLPAIASPGVSNIVSAGMNMLPSPGIGLSGVGAVSPGAVPGPLNMIRRPREGMTLGRSPEEQRHMLMQELRHQAVQGNSQAAAALSNLSSSLSSSVTVSSPTQTFGGQQKQQQLQSQNQFNQGSSINQQAYFMRLANERQQHQQKRMLQQQPSFPTNNSRQAPLPASQSHPLSQQHVLPSHSGFSEQPHTLPHQQHLVPSSQPQQQAGPQQQQSVLPLASAASQQSNQSSGTTSSLNSNAQGPQQQQTVSQPSSSAHVQLSSQTKQQLQNSLSKNQHMQQQNQQPQQQQHQLRASSKGNGRGVTQMQGFLAQQTQPSLLLDQQLQNQPMTHTLQGQRLFQSQGPTAVSMGKQPAGISCTALTGQGNQLQGKSSGGAQSVGQSLTSTTQQQKVPSPHFQSKQQFIQLSNSGMSTSSGPSCVQCPLSPQTSFQQQQQPPATQTVSSQQQQGTSTLQPVASQQLQQRRAMQQAHSTQHRPQQRPSVSNVGVQLSSQLGKTGLQQQSPTSSQLPVPLGNGVFQHGSNVNNPISMGPSSSIPVSSPVASNSAAASAAPWRQGPNFSPISAGIYNLSRSNNATSVQISSVASSGVPSTSSSANIGIVGTSTSLLSHAVSGGVLPQQSTVQMSGVQGQRLGVNSTVSGRPTPSPQSGMHIRQQSHGTLQSSNNTSSLASVPARPVPAPSGVFPGPTIGAPGGSVGSPGQPGSVSGSMMYNSVQPRQIQSGPMATQGATPSSASRPGASSAHLGSGSATSSSSVITGSSNLKRL